MGAGKILAKPDVTLAGNLHWTIVQVINVGRFSLILVKQSPFHPPPSKVELWSSQAVHKQTKSFSMGEEGQKMRQRHR